ncbi:hypothetical protein D3C84_987420 [compost metagenome]
MRDHEGLGNRLVVADRQRRVFIGAVCQRLVDKQVTRRTPQHIDHFGVGHAFFDQPLNEPLTGSLRGKTDTMAHQILLFTHQSNPSSQPSRRSKASLNVRSSCNGVIDT